MTIHAHDSNLLVTQITTVKLPPDKQDEVLNLMIERARFMAMQPGFVSIALHRSKDGSHVVNYVQWRNVDTLAAAHHSPEFRKKWPQFGKIAEEIDPCLYDLVHVEAGLAALALPRLCSLLGVAIELLEFPLSFGAAIRRMNSLVLVVLAHFMQSQFYARCLRSTGLEMEHLRELE